LDALIEGASSLASNDNVPSSSTPTVSKKPEVKGTLESFGNPIQQSGAGMETAFTLAPEGRRYPHHYNTF